MDPVTQGALRDPGLCCVTASPYAESVHLPDSPRKLVGNDKAVTQQFHAPAIKLGRDVVTQQAE